MSGIRARRSLGTLGRALFELRSSSQCTRGVLDTFAKEKLFRHVLSQTGGVPSRSFLSFPGERFSRQYGTMQFMDSGKLIERRWITSKSLPQSVRVFNKAFHSSRPSQHPSIGRNSQTVSKVAGENAKTAGENAEALPGGLVSWARLASLVASGVTLFLAWDLQKKLELIVLSSEKGAVAKTGPELGRQRLGVPSS